MGAAVERGLVAILSLALIGLVGFVLVTKTSILSGLFGTDDKALFGQNVFDLCTQPGNKSQGELAADAKVFPIDDITHTRYVELFERIPANRRATSKADLDAIICVKDRMQNVENETYYNLETGKPVAGCVRERHITNLYLIDVKTGTTISQQEMQGNVPGTCPSLIEDTMYLRGEPVSLDKIMEWVNIQLN